MDERQIGLALALNEVGVSSDISSFDNRLILQKTIYLLEQAGVRLGYSFNWHLRGPYSRGLTRDLYELAATKEDVAEWSLDEQSKAIATRLKSLIDSQANESVAIKAKRLELLASLQYLARRHGLKVDDLDNATAKLVQFGKNFSRNDVENAIRGLKEVELL